MSSKRKASSKEIDSSDLSRPTFTRVSLAEAERSVIAREFSSHVDEVVGMINDGKEATVYLCRARPIAEVEYLAAKMYRARKFRAFSNETTYINTGKIRDRRMAKAMRQKSRHGRDAVHHQWIGREWQMLETLHEAGASVPKPYMQCSDGIVMEYIGSGMERAPALAELRLDRDEAARIFPIVVRDMEIMLECGIVHGDLSAYNVLYLDGAPRMIDLPQATRIDDAVDPWSLFHRDVVNICEYFGKRGVETDALDLALRLWQ